ncbi:MAG: hypothetical protein U0570_08410 [Phycisphaerales bacterium]
MKAVLRNGWNWAGLAAGVLLIALWCGSGWWSMRLITGWGIDTGFGHGSIWFGVGSNEATRQWATGLFLQRNEAPTHWWFRFMGVGTDSYWWMSVPIWVPASVYGLAAIFVWLARAKGRCSQETCRRCAYNLAGISPHTACPECGESEKSEISV